MKKTNAQKFSREFEAFVLEYLKYNYNITDDNFSRLTPTTGDGGYDGVIYWLKSDSPHNIHETLFEAKLRSALGYALPMNDFSKSLIIAVNRFSDELYIATNITFSSETIKQLNIFSNRTGIAVKTLNGKDLYKWFKNTTLNNDVRFDTEFINFLERSAEKITEYRLTDSFCYDNQSVSPYIQDYVRSKSIDELQKTILSARKGTILIDGKRGSGKSRMALEIQYKLKKSGYLTAEIDVRYANTSRVIFLELLQIIWGISPETIINCSEGELELIFSEIGKKRLEKDKIECFKQIFNKDIEEYTGHWDVYQLYLIELVDILFAHYTERINFCIHIHNLDAGYYESCQFIWKIVSKLQNYNILFLIELRNDYNGISHISKTYWNKICDNFNTLESVLKRYYVSELSLEEKEQYIVWKFPNLSKHQVTFLSNEVSDNPLILNSTMEILISNLSTMELFGIEFSDVEFKKELNYFKKTYENEIVSRLIYSKVRLEGFERLVLPLALISILNGKCNIKYMQKIIGYDKDELIEILLDIGIFYIRNDIIEIKHELYLNSLLKYSEYISNSSLQQLAEKMLNQIDIFYSDALQKEMLKLKLLNILNQKYSFIELSCEIGKTLIQQGDLQQALHIYECGYEELKYVSCVNVKYTLIKLEILKKMLYIHAISKGDNSNEMRCLLDVFHCIIIQNRRILKHNDAYIDACLNYMIFEMKQFHRMAKHSECLEYAYIARRVARKVGSYYSHPETMEQILWLKSLSIKHISGIQACMQSFKNDIHKNPGLPLLIYSYNTHKTSTISRNEPQTALKYFKANEKYYSALSMADQLHNRVNIANMYFFLKKYDESINMAKEIIGDAIIYDIKIELGRSYNLIGNYCVLSENNEGGINYYKKSIEIFERLQNYINLWPPLVNLSYVYFNCKDYLNALNYAEKAIKIILLRKEELHVNEEKDANNGAKLYIGTIIILHILYGILPHNAKAKLIYNLFNDNIKQYLSAKILKVIESEKEYRDFFKDSAYEHNSKILLKL